MFSLYELFVIVGGFLSPLFDIKYVPINLGLILLCRAFFSFAFYLHYQKFGDPSKERSEKFDRSFWIRFIIKNFVVIFLCMFNLFIAGMMGLYSLFVGIKYMNKIINDHARDKFQIVCKLAIGVGYVSASVIIFFSMGFFSIPMDSITFGSTLTIDMNLVLLVAQFIPIVLGIIIFFFPGRFFANLTYEQVKINYRRIFFSGIHGKPAIRAILIIIIVTIPSFIVGGILYTYPKMEYYDLEMSDGIKLATTVFYSSKVGKAPAPVIYESSPYGLRESMPWTDVSKYNAMGYHVVMQDSRASYSSGGDPETLLITTSYIDGNDTINWIAEQSWCNGNVGTTGMSAMAINAYMAAGCGPDALKAQFLRVGTPDLIRDAILEGSFREELVVAWAEFTAPQSSRYQLDMIYDLVNDPAVMASSWAPEVVTLNEGPNTYDQVDVQAIHVGGWYDIFLRGTIRGYQGYNELGTANAQGHQKLVIGPWTHLGMGGTSQGDINYPNNARDPQIMSDWEEAIFRDAFGEEEVSGDFWDKNVAYYLMGDPEDDEANYWKYADSWPLDYDVEPWYMVKDTSGNTMLIDESQTMPSAANISYVYDPRNPVGTSGGALLFSFDCGPKDQREVEEENGELRSDVLVFESDVLTEAVEFEGNLQVKLNIMSNCTDTDFVVKLCDIYPDGSRILINDACLRSRYRNNNLTSFDDWAITEEFLNPGEEYVLLIDMVATAYRFNAGHQIGITVTSSNYPRFSVNPNTGGFASQSFVEGYNANNTIITGSGKSCVYFPVI